MRDELVERHLETLKQVEQLLAGGAYYADDDECHPLYPKAVAARQFMDRHIAALEAQLAERDAAARERDALRLENERLREDKSCRNCDGTGWVCENHRDHPWAGLANVEECCGGAGAPCGACNLDMACAGRVDRALKALRVALEPFAKSGELLVRAGDAGDFWAYRPAGGDEYGITGKDLLAARTALKGEQP